MGEYILLCYERLEKANYLEVCNIQEHKVKELGKIIKDNMSYTSVTIVRKSDDKIIEVIE